jgi:hypothetical protein
VSSKVQDRQIALRVTAETVERAERLVPVMQKQPEWEPFRMTASSVMRVALLKGLDRLEAEFTRGRRPQS